ncbi:2-phosphosulfolactate phosphatase [Microbacterium amylolyticum]|uniref:Probable 2-phosphosulfolactate phosphatase n=1 Tax=Microbacterium amylolyticum TaxID=936337 RepID=A0ABS4ZGY4_9MICO|nr:2-phosphosulfolactate phosphatase [Microbacterium amylolyticum]MBP2436537.1 2-phosphosulfolactate phosphatase [Microbacterium amylolyticum]
MTDPRSQSPYQVRLAWGARGWAALAPSDVIVVVDAIGRDDRLVSALADRADTVMAASLRNATATAQAVLDTQTARRQRTSVALVLAGDDGAFAVEDYLAAGAIADALTQRGLDHSAPDVAVAAEGFHGLRRAVKHLVSASATGVALAAEGYRERVAAAAEIDAETAPAIISAPSV